MKQKILQNIVFCIFLITSTITFGQTDLVRWDLTSDGSVSYNHPSVLGDVFHSPENQNPISYNILGALTTGWNNNNIEHYRSVSISLSSADGNPVDIESLMFEHEATTNPPTNYTIRYYIAPNNNPIGTYDFFYNQSSVLINNESISANPIKNIPLNLTISGTQKLIIRFYTSGNNWSSGWRFKANTLKITGPSLITTDLAITQTVDNPSPVVCQDNVTFTLTASNLGNNPSEVTVTDLLPSGYEYVSSNATQGTYNPVNGIWSVGNLNVNQNATLSITANVLASGNHTNTAVISGNTGDPNLSNNTATVSVTPDFSNIVDLEITKSVNNNTPEVASNVDFTINIQNPGSNTATGVTVTDVLPSGYDFVSSSQGTYNPDTRTITWNIGNLSGLTSTSFTITAQVRASGNYNNTASVTSNQCEANPNNNTASVSVSPIPTSHFDLSISQTASTDNPTIGSIVTLTITAQNSGPMTATGAIVNTLLTNGLLFVNATTSVGSYDSITNTWTIGNMASSTSATLTITAQVLGGEGLAYLSIAEITSNNIIYDANLINNKSYYIFSPDGQEFLECNTNAENPIFEENFGSGTAMFGGELLPGITNMVYNEPSQPASWPNALSDGQYSITRSIEYVNTGWQSNITDPSTPDGYFMAINADYDPNEFFRIRIMLTEDFCDNTRYSINFKVINVNSLADFNHCNSNEGGIISPEIGYFVENNMGEILGAGTSGIIPFNSNAEWQNKEFVFTSGTDNQWIEFVLFNKAPGGCGNDLAIDDIVVYACLTAPIELDIVIDGGNSEICGEESVTMEVIYSDTNYVWPPVEWGTEPEDVDYQWQYSTDGIVWSNLPGETEDALTIDNFAQENEGYYRLQYAQAGNIDRELCRYVSAQFFQVFTATPNLNPIELDGITESDLCLGAGPFQITSDYDFSDDYDEWNENYHYFEWESSNTGVATIDQNGLLTLVASGITTITFTVHSPNGECTSSITREITVLDGNCNPPRRYLITNPMIRQRVN